MHIDFRNKYKIIVVLLVTACSSLSGKKNAAAVKQCTPKNPADQSCVKPQPVLPPKQIKKTLDPTKNKSQPPPPPKAPKSPKTRKPGDDELPNRGDDPF